MISTIQKPDIISVLSSEGFELKQKGKSFWGLCPFALEKTPSFKVSPERQAFYCFSCHAKGDVITLIEKLKGISFQEALKYLGIDTGTPYRPDPLDIHKKELITDFQAWCRKYYAYLCDLLIRFEKIKKSLRTEKQVEAYAKYYHLESVWTMHLDVLLSRDNKAKFDLYQEVINEN